MPTGSKTLGYGKVLPQMLAVYFVLGAWEMINGGPGPSPPHYANWGPGVLVTLLGLPLIAYVLAKHPGARSRFFVFGFGGSTLFVWRFRATNPNEFMDWMNRAPSTLFVGLCWIAFAFVLGLFCWLAAGQPRDANDLSSDNSSQQNDAEGRTEIHRR